MSHSLFRLTEKISKKPHLVTKDFMQFVCMKLENRNEGEELGIDSQGSARRVSDYEVSVENGISIIPITGPLTYEFTSFAFMCGMTTYQGIKANVERSIELGADTIVFDVDTPGGEAYACFETSQYIRDICDQAGVTIISYVDGLSASAGYSLTSISDVIISNPMSKIGSIGVVVGFLNDIPKKIKEGSEAVFIYAGDSKIPYDSEGKMRDDWKEEIQQDVDNLYESFVSHVASMRGISEEAVRNTEAKVFSAEESVSLGLIDEIMNHAEFEEYLVELSDKDKEDRMPLLRRKRDKEEEMSEITPAQTNLENETEENLEMSQEQLTQDQLDAKIKAAREEAAQESQAQLAALEARIKAFEEAEAQAERASMEERVAEFSFVNKEDSADLVSALLSMDQKASAALLQTLEQAQSSVEASVTTVTGDEGDGEDITPEEKTKAAVREKQAARYKTK